MRHSRRLLFRSSSIRLRHSGISAEPVKGGSVPLILIEKGTFYRQHPAVRDPASATNLLLFPELSFQLPSNRTDDKHHQQEHWAVVGRESKAAFLDILRGRYTCAPASARSYPYLNSNEIAKKDIRLRNPERSIQHVGFHGEKSSSTGGIRGAYLSARYESRREETDWTVEQYLRGETELNPAEKEESCGNIALGRLNKVMKDLRLEKLASMPVSNLSNGQTRRAKIAKALLGSPEVLLLDEPFMGLDPPTLTTISPLLRELAYKASPSLLLSLRPQDPIPDWITHLIWLGDNNRAAMQGPIYSVLCAVRCWTNPTPFGRKAIDEAQEMTKAFGDAPTLADMGAVLSDHGIREDTFLPMLLKEWEQSQSGSTESEVSTLHNLRRTSSLLPASPTAIFFWATKLPLNQRQHEANKNVSARGFPPQATLRPASFPALGAPLIELTNVVVKYGAKVVLGASRDMTFPSGFNLWIHAGTRLAVMGPNGSGKTTLLSLLTSDHPQSYSLPIKHFGRTRLPTKGRPGISLFDIQSRIGHSSPEIHAFFPRHLSIRQTLQSAFSDTFLGKPSLTPERKAQVDAILRWFELDLNLDYASTTKGLSKPSQDTAWADSPRTCFSSLPFPYQRLLLLLRALVKSPSILILDEAFSGLAPDLREKAMTFLECGETMVSYREHLADGGSTVWARRPNTELASTEAQRPVFKGLSDEQALVVVSHVKEEIPACVNEYLRLPGEDEIEFGREVERGICGAGGLRTPEGWRRIWSS